MKSVVLKPDVIRHNTIISGHARNGQQNELYNLLSEIDQDWVELLKPNIASFNIVVSRFQQSGLRYETEIVSDQAITLHQLLFGSIAKCVSETTSSHTQSCITLVPFRDGECILRLLSFNLRDSSTRLQSYGSFEFGRALNGYILKSTNIEPNVTLEGALIHMYMKCGCVADAKLVSESVIAEDCSMRCHGLRLFSSWVGQEWCCLVQRKGNLETFLRIWTRMVFPLDCTGEDLAKKGCDYLNSWSSHIFLLIWEITRA